MGGLVGQETAAFSAKRANGLRGATFGALTSQDNPLAIRLSSNGMRVERIAFHWDAKCTSGTVFSFGDILAPTAKPPSGPVGEDPYLPLSKSGSFKGSTLAVRDLGNGRMATLSQVISGKLGESNGAGTWSAHLDAVDVASGQKVDTCDTGTIKWTAPKPQTLYYAGATSQDEPLVLQLKKNRRTVRSFRIGWTADCFAAGAPPGSPPLNVFSVGEALANFPIKADKFGDTFSNTYARQDGGANKFDFEVTGKVGKKKAGGSFHALMTSTSSSGVTEGTCESPKVTWNAKQGPGKARLKHKRRR
jgi:hypothetical protein